MEKAINSFMTDFDIDIYNAQFRLMSSEISTYLTGRYITFRIFLFLFQSTCPSE